MERIKKTIVIVGGGISGLSLLHYLKMKYYFQDEVVIQLFEKGGRPGGTVASLHDAGCLFETGPNGFLDSKLQVVELAKELGLHERLHYARDDAKIRYIQYQGQLHALPSGLKDFLSFQPLGVLDKLRVLAELLLPRGGHIQESVFDFGCRRLGKRFAEVFLDPMVSGIYGGDARQTSLHGAFPKMVALEKGHRSLFLAMAARQRQKNKKSLAGGGMPGGRLMSFEGGMGELIAALADRYRAHIHGDTVIKTISRHDKKYVLYTADTQYTADEVYLCTPAYEAQVLVEGFSGALSRLLGEVCYSPIIVVGLVFPKTQVHNRRPGYGYLIPSSEKKKVLGVLFEDNIFESRCPQEAVLFRVMLGGARHPHILQAAKEDLVALALEEIRGTCQVEGAPSKVFYKAWAQGIPQYGLNYVDWQQQLDAEVRRWPALHLLANYRQGIAFGDCVANARLMAQV